MSDQAASAPIYNLLPTEVEGSIPGRACLDLHWSWNHATTECGALDPILWTHSKSLGCPADVSRDHSSACWPILPSVRTLMTCCDQAAGGGDTHGSSKSIRKPFDLRRVFQHGIHVERSAPDLFGGLAMWRATTQSCQRFGCASAGVGLLYQQGYFASDRQGRERNRPLSYNDPGSCRSRLCATRTRVVAVGIALPGYSCGCAPGRSKSAG